MNPKEKEQVKKLYDKILEWRKDIFKFTRDVLNVSPALCKDEMKGAEISYIDDITGEEVKAVLFDENGNIVHHNLKAYTRDDFKDQYETFDKKKSFTWQQTLTLTAYNRALQTFDKPSFEQAMRYITVVSGHGTGKTRTISVIALHFLTCFFGSQCGMTSNTDAQVNDVFMKEVYKVKTMMKSPFCDWFDMVEQMIRVQGQKDWFLRARVARPERPEALAGLHSKYVLIIVDEASGIPEKVFETMKGALTEGNFVVIYTSNGTQAFGEFYDSHRPTAPYTQLQFSSEDSPLVTREYVKSWEEKYGRESDEFKIRVSGGFPNEGVADDKGWTPLFSNVNIKFEPRKQQGFKYPVLGIDPAGSGKDHTEIVIRDDFFMEELYNEEETDEKVLARKVEELRDVYNIKSSDIGIDAFGVGAKVLVHIETAVDDNVTALLTDKPREETKELFVSFNAEMAWRFREWLIKGGTIITDNPTRWKRQLEKIMYRRVKGKIQLMPKEEFKKKWGFSPDLFDAGKFTFHVEDGYRPLVKDKNTREREEHEAWLAKHGEGVDNHSIDQFSSV